MSKISDMYEQIKLHQYILMRTKLQEAVKARKEKRELSKEEEQDYAFMYDEVTILVSMLEEQELREGKDFIGFVAKAAEYDEPDRSFFVMKIDGDYIEISTNSWGGEYIPTITNIESIREELDFYGKLEDDMYQEVDLTDIDLTQIQIGTTSTEAKHNDVSFVQKILGYATARVEARRTVCMAAQLAQGYEQQSTSGQPSLEDDN